MHLISAHDDDDAIAQAKHMAHSDECGHLKMSRVERHVPIMESEEQVNEMIDQLFEARSKEEKKAKARAHAAHIIATGQGSEALRKRLAKMHNIPYTATSGAKAKAAPKPKTHAAPAEKPKDTSSTHSVRALNAARQAAYYARGGREGFGSGGGSSHVSPLEKAMTKVAEKPKKGAGASPSELKAEKPLRPAKSSAEKKLAKMGRVDEELNTDMLKKSKENLKRKYQAKTRSTKTATGEKADKVVTDVSIKDSSSTDSDKNKK
jgi:hypothetical protein